ncbi:MAG: gamma-butyrobetaine hydroxylase-like domain-containing protein [Opitutales bacterium]
MEAPKQIQIIGNELAIIWPDGSEVFLDGEFLRTHSPSAENRGEIDVLGNRWGGDGPRAFPGVMLQHFELVGNYAIRPLFSDGHQTGIFSWKYLKELAEKTSSPSDD